MLWGLSTAFLGCAGAGFFVALQLRADHPNSTTERIAWAVVVGLVVGAVILGSIALKNRRPTKHSAPGDPARSPLLLNDVRAWLQRQLSTPQLGATEVYALGSIVHGYASNDVDLVILFNTDDDSALRARHRVLTRVKREFLRRFGLPLHTTCYTTMDGTSGRAAAFLARNTTVRLIPSGESNNGPTALSSD